MQTGHRSMQSSTGRCGNPQTESARALCYVAQHCQQEASSAQIADSSQYACTLEPHAHKNLQQYVTQLVAYDMPNDRAAVNCTALPVQDPSVLWFLPGADESM